MENQIVSDAVETEQSEDAENSDMSSLDFADGADIDGLEENRRAHRARIRERRRARNRRTSDSQEVESAQYNVTDIILTPLEKLFRGPRKVVEKWISTSVHHFAPYLPQMGDHVYYVKAGHLAFAQKVQAFIPIEVNEDLNEVIFGQVQNIEFKLDPILVCDLTLGVYPFMDTDNFSPDLTPDLPQITIRWFDFDGQADFLILYHDFKPSISKEWNVGDNLKARFEDSEGIPVRVISVSNERSPWRRYTVEYVETADDSITTDAFSPWELCNLDENFPVIPKLALFERQRIREIVADTMSNSNLKAFVRAVRYKFIPEYLEIIAYPIYISLILNRLDHDFYRSTDQVMQDWATMCSNAVEFNGIDSDLSQIVLNELQPVLNQISGEISFEPRTVAENEDDQDEELPHRRHRRRKDYTNRDIMLSSSSETDSDFNQRRNRRLSARVLASARDQSLSREIQRPRRSGVETSPSGFDSRGTAHQNANDTHARKRRYQIPSSPEVPIHNRSTGALKGKSTANGEDSVALESSPSSKYSSPRFKVRISKKQIIMTEEKNDHELTEFKNSSKDDSKNAIVPSINTRHRTTRLAAQSSARGQSKRELEGRISRRREFRSSRGKRTEKGDAGDDSQSVDIDDLVDYEDYSENTRRKRTKNADSDGEFESEDQNSEGESVGNSDSENDVPLNKHQTKARASGSRRTAQHRKKASRTRKRKQNSDSSEELLEADTESDLSDISDNFSDLD